MLTMIDNITCSCGKEIPENVIFCRFCGKRKRDEKPEVYYKSFLHVCSRCNWKEEAGKKVNAIYCPNCGKKNSIKLVET